ncbi:hypothetical protein VDGL01_04038 [Verticillium dahliae]
MRHLIGETLGTPTSRESHVVGLDNLTSLVQLGGRQGDSQAPSHFPERGVSSIPLHTSIGFSTPQSETQHRVPGGMVSAFIEAIPGTMYDAPGLAATTSPKTAIKIRVITQSTHGYASATRWPSRAYRHPSNPPPLAGHGAPEQALNSLTADFTSDIASHSWVCTVASC